MKQSFSLLLCLLGCFYAYSDGLVSGSLEVRGGVLLGQSREYVVNPDRSILSRLDWDENGVPSVTVAGQLNVWNFFLAASVVSAIPAKSGLMQDYDWELPDKTRYTSYSQHTAHIDHHFDGSAKLGYTWRVKNWRFSPALGFLYRTRQWSASDGYLQYGKPIIVKGETVSDYLTGNEQKRNLFGTSISYKQNMHIPSIGIEVGYRFNEQFELMLDGSVYPYMRIDSFDSHFLRLTQWHDEMDGGIGGAVRLSALWKPAFAANRFAFKFNVGYEFIGSARGSDSYAYIGDAAYIDGKVYRGFMLLDPQGAKMDSNSIPITLGIVFYF
jgi:outer membrane protease